MRETTDAILKCMYRRREQKTGDEEEPAWVNEETKGGINERKVKQEQEKCRMQRERRKVESYI